ncbi:MAG: beta-galactosidase trimerization domain-containing protein [Planctomycetes bacterium]|nr:beta-galactosidase trimerization domain-containing protein [Planctomycetota bacterium]
MDLDSPYLDYLCDQLAEVLERYHPVDGIWFDMCWDQVSCSSWAIAAMTKKGLDPASDADRRRHAGELAEASMARLAAQVRAAAPGALIYFNVRPVGNLPKEHQYMEQVEIESLPTGGWGYMHFPKTVRRVRRFGKPYLGMTARFHGSWADFGGLKPYPALEYETSLMVAHGAQCSIGDQLHPRGRLEPEAYDLIGRAYARIEAREPWLTGAVPVTEVAVIETMPDHTQRHLQSIDGAVRMLNQLRQQFDIVRTDEDLSRYRLLILPDDMVIDERLAAKLRARLAAGCRILATGWSGLSEDATAVVLSELGISAHGESAFTDTYIRARPGSGVLRPDSDHVVHGKGVQVRPSGSSKVVADLVEPYFQRSWRGWCSHRQTPPDRVAEFAGAVVTGSTAYACWPLFDAFARHGNAPLRNLVGELIDRLLPDPLLRAGGPTGLQTTVCRQDQRLIAHLLFYPAERRAVDIDLIEDIIPLHDVPLSVRAERSPRRVYLAPENRDLPFQYRAGRVEVVVPEIAGHAMVVFE